MPLKSPFHKPTEIDILGIICMMIGAFLTGAGFQSAYRLRHATDPIGEETYSQDLLMGMVGVGVMLVSLLFFFRQSKARQKDLLDEDALSERD